MRALFANSCTSFSASRSQVPPEMQIGAALFTTDGWKSAAALTGFGREEGLQSGGALSQACRI